MFLYIREYEIWFCLEIFLQLIHMDKPQTPPSPYVDLCGYFTNPLPPPSRYTWFVDVPLYDIRCGFNKKFDIVETFFWPAESVFMELKFLFLIFI